MYLTEPKNYEIKEKFHQNIQKPSKVIIYIIYTYM